MKQSKSERGRLGVRALVFPMNMGGRMGSDGVLLPMKVRKGGSSGLAVMALVFAWNMNESGRVYRPVFFLMKANVGMSMSLDDGVLVFIMGVGAVV